MLWCYSLLLNASVLLLATNASADIINMRCQGALHQYDLRYDDDTYKCSPSGPVRQTFGLEEWRISGSS